MEHIYTSYCKTIENTTFYFVKKFLIIPELNDVPPILESYGMHTNFDKACEIATVNEKIIKERLLQEIKGNAGAKVVEMANAGVTNKKHKRIKFL